ncbi:MAG: HAD family hydrolase [Cyanobacteria bacterium P01_D01_bin.105]
MPQRLSPASLTPSCRAQLASIRLLATDMDGTLTVNGQFESGLLTAFERLHAVGLPVMIVTGRSAGWVSGLVHYLPVVGAIAENGGVYIAKHTAADAVIEAAPMILPDIPRMTQHRDRLETLFNKLRARYPNLRPSADNAFRITDWTFNIDGLSQDDIALMQETCAHHTMGFTYSTVQCHLKIQTQNKANGLAHVLQQHFPQLSPNQVLTIGDSPNDESLFDTAQFPCSVGVANVSRYLPELTHQPQYVTQSPEGKGFIDVVDCLIAART